MPSGDMSFIRLLALSYLAWALVFVIAAMLMAHLPLPEDIARDARSALAQKAGKAVARIDLTPQAPVSPAQDFRTWARADVAPPEPQVVQAPKQKPGEADQIPPDTIAILPDLPLPPLPKRVARSERHAATPAFHIPDPPAYAITMPPKPPAPARAARKERHAAPTPAFRIPDPPPLDAPIFGLAEHAAAHLEGGLTPEMIRNFDLFLYVSKARSGPLSQRMYVFEKQRSGGLKLLYDWVVSTGREQYEVSPHGEHTVTTTPAGYYQFDPDRMYQSYHSSGWDQDMPNAMFFNWEREGLQTGLAIHAATGGDIGRLGSRASAGCIHLAPENARILFNLIRKEYRGPVPRFAYDHDSQTMSNQGKFMHDGAGNLKMADGYRVLIRIENYGGGGDMVAALF
jgi:hypothetical protein